MITLSLKVLTISLIIISSSVFAASEKGTIRIALDDLPGVDMLPTLIAIERSKAKGINIDVSYMLSEGMAMRTILNRQADIGMGTPYQAIQNTKAPIRMFYQLSKLRFHPIVDTRYITNWKQLDGVEMYSHGKGSGTEALVNMMAKKNGINYKRMIYLPGSGVRANAMINGRIHATVVDTERKNLLIARPNSPFKVLPIPEINASDETLYAHKSFLDSHRNELSVLINELLIVWRSMIDEPGFIAREKSRLNILPNIKTAEIDLFFSEMVSESAFPRDGGLNSAFKADIDFYGFAGTIKGTPNKFKAEDFWDFTLLQQSQ